MTRAVNRFLAGPLAALTVASTTFVSPPAQAWNPFHWMANSSGSIVNRVEHGVVGGLITAVGAVICITGLALVPELPVAELGAVVALYGASVLGGAVFNRTAGTPWRWVAQHLLFYPTGKQSSGPGSNVPRNGGPGNGGNGGTASQQVGLGQAR